jgi:hypothetical protein
MRGLETRALWVRELLTMKEEAERNYTFQCAVEHMPGRD